ncbi:MAG: L-Ala-D/L-Glu epimerase [Actinomycetota bacterium]|jgi:L-alanine-DL-glutamate epimerase-like enolase superfamily enzyme|nr:L-Ala-D/L-Glu epimerase [Actinomycetota bacterium]
MADDWSRESWSLEAQAIELKLKERFKIARETWDTTTNVFVTLRFAGVSGVGESSPDGHWGETVESVLQQLREVDVASLGNPFNLEGVRELLPAGSARAALDIALHDLAGKIAGVPVCKLLGTKGRPLPPTSLTVPIAEPESMLERVRSLADHPALKVKVGFDGDVDFIRSMRAVFDGAIRVDANEGWSADDAIERLNELERFNIELCEQPIKSGNHEDMERVTNGTTIPIFADEDVSTAADVVALKGVVNGVNLKLRKAGGIREMVAAIQTARACGLGVMIGCDLDTGIAVTAGAHVAGLVDFADLDGPTLLAEDPFPGLRYDKGRMILPDLPGLGVEGTP